MAQSHRSGLSRAIHQKLWRVAALRRFAPPGKLHRGEGQKTVYGTETPRIERRDGPSTSPSTEGPRFLETTFGWSPSERRFSEGEKKQKGSRLGPASKKLIPASVPLVWAAVYHRPFVLHACTLWPTHFTLKVREYANGSFYFDFKFFYPFSFNFLLLLLQFLLLIKELSTSFIYQRNSFALWALILRLHTLSLLGSSFISYV